MPEDRRQREVDRLSPDKQVDVYLAGITEIEPPLMMDEYLAANWKSVLPVIRDRMALGSDDRLPRLMPTLVTISNKYCSLADRKDVLDAVSAALPRMGGLYQASAEEDLNKIAHPTKQLAHCQ